MINNVGAGIHYIDAVMLRTNICGIDNVKNSSILEIPHFFSRIVGCCFGYCDQYCDW